MSAACRLHLLRKRALAASPALPKRVGRGGSGPVAFVPRGPGEALAPETRRSMEQWFGHDLSEVRVHAGRDAARAARTMDAAAFASGTHIGFAHGRYDPLSGTGRALLAHELAHVVQQAGTGAAAGRGRGASLEAEADAAADAVTRGAPAPALSEAGPGLQRKVVLRDVGRGEQSGFARRDEFVTRLNNLECGLTFTLAADGTLTSALDPTETLNDFGRKMQSFTDPATALVPLRLTTRQGLLRSAPGGPFNSRVDADAWASGYVDIDDMLASDDLGFQVVLVHFLTERATTRDYARRIGTLDDTSREFDRAHSRGVTAEVELLRDFFGDPSIRLLQDGGTGGVFRRYRNDRGDTIRARTPPAPRAQAGVDRNLMDVRLRNGTIMTVDDYRRLLESERARDLRRRLLELRGGPQGPAP